MRRLFTGLIVGCIAFAAGIAVMRAVGYREVHFPQCDLPEPRVFPAALAPGRLDAFFWGSSRGPVNLRVAMGEQPIEETTLLPDNDGVVSWSYHGDWYADLVIDFSGEACRVNLTYRL